MASPIACSRSRLQSTRRLRQFGGRCRRGNGSRPGRGRLRGRATYAEWTGEDGRFALNGLLAGTYSLWAFVDRDGNGEYGSGSLNPFRYSEPYGRYSEPIDLDAGQIVAEVEISCR